MAVRIGKLVLTNLLLLAVGLFAVEMIFGNWLRSDRLNRLHLIKGVELRYDIDGLYPAANTQVVYRRDHYGLRGNYGRPDGIDILTMGGSTTDQRYITEGATWQDVLQKHFLSEGTTVSVANAGVDGQSTFGYVKNFDWWFPEIPGLKAKYVLFYVGINDFHKKGEGGKFDGLIDRPQLTPGYIKQEIREKSALYHLYLTAKGIYEAGENELRYMRIDFHALKWVDRPAASDHEALMGDRLRAYGERLRALDGRTRKFGATPIYVTQPTRWCKISGGKIIGAAEKTEFDGVSINGVDRCIMMRLLNTETLETCRDVGGICIDLAGEMEFDDGDFYDYHHNTPQGAAKIGHYMYQRLRPLFPRER